MVLVWGVDSHVARVVPALGAGESLSRGRPGHFTTTSSYRHDLACQKKLQADGSGARRGIAGGSGGVLRAQMGWISMSRFQGWQTHRFAIEIRKSP
jgi:hypothetical protein